MVQIVVVMGVAGSGKTTVGTRLAEAMHCAYLEGDSLHSPANVEKMTHGIPLTDADRAPWLAYLKGSAALIRSRLQHRSGHYMKADMLASQFDALEEPSDALIVDVSPPPDAIVEQILTELRRPPHTDLPRSATPQKGGA